ncbi:hypothetical protein Pla110_03080 [Polystyrenella longa]|uniref:Uncharacterized protein n=1 Tax=Polystyrenella longa TaxID=2528007 RepID=A0A518CHF7_9PLAN|nr:hypothetical protein [Polystyrenella longa]QDU78604.1 hypothetical protein Pla110_03080 [Polystyrenella longa]
MKLDDVYEELLSIVSNCGAQIDVPIESERFFENLVDGFQGNQVEFVSFARENVGGWFRSIPIDGPNWIQEAEWQFHNNKPMVFVGEVSIPKSTGLYHDDACLFAFISEDGVTKSVIQVA